MIREAKYTDIWQLLELCEDFFYTSHLKTFSSFDEKSMENTLNNLITNDSSVLYVIDKDSIITGMIAVVSGGAFYNDKTTMAQELFWYVKPEFRGSLESIKLTKKAQEWAKNIGANVFVLAHLRDEKGDKLHDYYTREGFELRENFYYKRIG